MAANDHADAVRSYLEYLCETPRPIEATPWADWTKVTVVGLALGAGACGGEVDAEGGQGGSAAGGVIANGGTAYGIGTGGRGSMATGGVRVSGSGGLGALYGLPLGGY